MKGGDIGLEDEELDKKWHLDQAPHQGVDVGKAGTTQANPVTSEWQ